MKLILNGKEEYILSDSGRDNYQFNKQSSLDDSLFVNNVNKLSLIESEDVIDSIPYHFDSTIGPIDFYYKLAGVDIVEFQNNINIGSSITFSIQNSGSGDLENFLACGAGFVETNGHMYSCLSYELGRLFFKVIAKDGGVKVYEKIVDICGYELGTTITCSLGFMRVQETNVNSGPNNKQVVFWIDIKTKNFNNYIFVAPDNSVALPTSGYTTKTLLPEDIYFVLSDFSGDRQIKGTVNKIFAGPYFILRNLNSCAGELNWIPYGNISSMTEDNVSFNGRNKYIQETSYHNIKFCAVNYSDFSVSTEESEFIAMYGNRIEKSILAVCKSSIDFSTTSDYSSYSIFHIYQTNQSVFGDCSIITDFDNQVCSSYNFDFKLICNKSGKILKSNSHSIYDLPEFCFAHWRASNEYYGGEEYYNPIGIHWAFNSQYDLNDAMKGYANTSNIPKNSRMMYVPDINSTFILTTEGYNSGFTSCRLNITKYKDSTTTTTILANASKKPLSSWMMDEDKIDPYYSMALCYGDYCYTSQSASNGGDKIRHLYAFWLSHESADDYFKVFFVTSTDDGDTWSAIKYIDFSDIAGANEAVVDFGVDCCGGVMIIIPIIGQTKEDRYSNQLNYLNAYILDEPILASSSLSTPSKYSIIYPYKDIGPFSPDQSILAIPKITTNKYLKEFYVSFVDASANGVGFVYGSSNGALWSLVAVPDNRSPNGILNASAELGLPDGSYPTFDVSGGMNVRDLSVVKDDNGFMHIVIEDKSSKMLTYFRVSPKYLSSIAKWNSVRMEANYISDTEVSLVDEEVGAIVSLQYNNVGFWDLRYKASDDNFGTVEKLRLINHDWSMFGNVATTDRIIGNMGPNLFLNNERIGLTYMSGIFHPTTGEFDGNDSINGIFAKFSFAFEQGRYGSRNPFIYGANSDTLYQFCDRPLIYPAFSKLGGVQYTHTNKTSIFPTGASDNHYVYFSPYLFNYQFPFGVDELYIYDNMKGSIGHQGMKIRLTFKCPTTVTSIPIMIHIHDYYKGASNYGSIRFILYYKPSINRVTITDVVGGGIYNTDFDVVHDADSITILDVYLQNARNDEDDSHTNIVVLRRFLKSGMNKYMNGNTSYEEHEGIIAMGKAYKMLNFDDPLYSPQSFIKFGWTDDDPPIVSTDYVDNVAIYMGRNDFPFTFIDFDQEETIMQSKDNVIGYPFSGISQGLTMLSYYDSPIVNDKIKIKVTGKNAFKEDNWSMTTNFDTASSSSTSVFFGGVSRFPISTTASALYVHVSKNMNGSQTSLPRYISIIDTNILEFYMTIKYKDLEAVLHEKNIYDMTQDYGYNDNVFSEFASRKTLASKMVDIVYQNRANSCLVLAAKNSLANNVGDYFGVFNVANMEEETGGYGIRRIADVYLVKDHETINGMSYYNIIFEEPDVEQNLNTDLQSDIVNDVLYCGIVFSNTCIVDLYKYITEDGDRVYDILKSNEYSVESIGIKYDDKFIKSIGVVAKTIFSKTTEEYITDVSRSRYGNELLFSNIIVARELEINKNLSSITLSVAPALSAQSAMSGESVSAVERHVSNSYVVESSGISKKDIRKKMLIRNEVNRENEFIIVGYNDCEFGSFVDKCTISSPVSINVVASDDSDTYSTISFQMTSTRTKRKGG